MGRKVTKARENVYCKYRLRAAQYNEAFMTRDGAADHVPGVTPESIKKYELDLTKPPNDVVALLADAYNAPELRAWYCANQCPLGGDRREIPEQPIERTVIRIMNTADDIDGVTTALAAIVDDGRIDDDEKAELPGIVDRLLEVRRRFDELIAALERIENS